MGDSERLCEMEVRLRLKRFSPPAGNSIHSTDLKMIVILGIEITLLIE